MRARLLGASVVAALVGLAPAAALGDVFPSGNEQQQTYTIPAGVTMVHIKAVGGSAGGKGAVVEADYPIPTGQTKLYVVVGFNGSLFGWPDAGGAGGNCTGYGGGSSDVRLVDMSRSNTLQSRVVVAGGAGGTGCGTIGTATGGDAGADAPGATYGGKAGTATGGGGSGGVANCQGWGLPSGGGFGQGGSGEAGGYEDGGGGGGGYYGGGGGGGYCNGSSAGGQAGGGGGGSSYTDPKALNVTTGLDQTATPEVEITAPVPTSTGKPAITGNALQGQTLTEAHATWSGNSPGYMYQWLRCDSGGNNCNPISGATSQTYVPVAADVGSTIRVDELTSDSYGTSLADQSSQTGVIASAIPVNTAPPTLSGPLTVGQQETDVHGAWTNTPTTYAYQWDRCDADGAAASCIPITGATGQSYTPTKDDLGMTLRVIETASNSFGQNPAVASQVSTDVQPAAPAVTTGAGTSVAETSALLNGTVDSNDGPTSAHFEYGTSPSLLGSASTATGSVPTGYGPNQVSARVTSLTPGTKYYFRLDAVDSQTGAYTSGPIASFTTQAPASVIPSTMSWYFTAFKAYTLVHAMVADNVPIGGHVTVACSGYGCGFTPVAVTVTRTKCHGAKCKKGKLRGTRTVNVSAPFKGEHLKPGAHITVTITARGAIGKRYLFTIKAGALPTWKRVCLAATGRATVSCD